ncbi:O-antigen ligase family protein [Tahibacter harae]|uniref:O-antigen ligase family protein n=1 Tax=Tahibacter harae TaxID=2963937 RepID=A0ABT1QU71_9GAMM|nr:O-antigen ligase family protein [Tahibacter harae]MCQ4165829.1 O-antigen ligase family protein [Tahibacter harae]
MAAAGATAARGIAGCLVAALVGTAWLIDPYAQAGFDAPKRLAALLAAGAGAALLLWQLNTHALRRDLARPDGAAATRGLARASLVAAALALAGLLLSALFADQPAGAWHSLRVQLLYLLLLPLGAARALHGAAARRVFLAAVVASAVNALLSLLQGAGVALPLAMSQLGGRYPTGALLGNEAYVALACALLGAAGVALGLAAAAPRTRWLGWGLCGLAVAVITFNRQTTAAAALLTAGATLLALRWHGTRRLLPAAALLALLLPLSAALPALRAQTWARLPYTVEQYQQLTTYRLGAWAAALEMLRSRPWTGHGPGSYAEQSQTQRFAAEIALRQRLAPAPPGTYFSQAHQDYLQLAAEAGLPVLLAVLAALSCLLGGLLRLARRAAALEARILLGVLVAGMVAALAWFPLQIPFVAVVLLLACGRAWRLLLDDAEAGA